MATPCDLTRMAMPNKKGYTVSDIQELTNSVIRPKGFKLYKATEVAHWPRVSWLVEGVIQRNSSAVIFGESRVGKSFLALDLAYKLAKGESWFGYQVEPCKVVFFAAESPSGLPDRLEAIKANSASEHPDNLYFMREDVDLSNITHVEKIIDTVDSDTDVLFIDTFNAVASNSDENSSKDIGLILRGVRRIVDETRCTVIFVHHCGWSEQDRMRGHSSFSAAMDTRIVVARDAGHPSWKVKGQREGADTEPHRYALRQIPVRNGSSCIVEPISKTPAAKVTAQPRTSNQKLVLELAKQLADGSELIDYQTLLTESANTICADVRHRRQRAEEAIESLLKAGFFQMSDSGAVLIKH